MAIEIKKLENSQVEIIGEIASRTFDDYVEKAIKKLSKNLEISGFRKGHIPENVLVQKVGEGTILEEAADMAMQEEYQKIISDRKIDAIGRPEVTITKLARKNPLGFKVKIAVLPEIKLPEYKKLANKTLGKKTEIKVTDSEVEEAILKIRETYPNNPTEKEEDGKAETKKELPKLDDELVKKLGDFKDVTHFKSELKKSILQEKELQEKSKQRSLLLDEILKHTDMILPDVLIESELDRMAIQFKGDVARMGVNYEDYIKNAGKTDEDLRNAWRGDAEKRAKTQLLLNEIAQKENISASDEELNHEVSHIMQHVKKADPERARHYAQTIITNEKVLQLLEEESVPEKTTQAK